MTPDQMFDAIEVLSAIDLGDFDLFCRRNALVADLGIHEREIVAKVKILQVVRLAFDERRFDVEIQGVEPVPAVVIGALDAYEDWRDLVAWPLNAPAKIRTLHGSVAVLGEHQLDVASPWGSPVPVYRDAVAWLRAGCVGVVPIDRRRAARRFIDFHGALVAEDDRHGHELAKARAELVDRAPAILVAEARKGAA